jgi:hypothetical protein
MSLSPALSNAAASAGSDAVVALANNGYLRMYDGVQPATADTAISGQVQLAELRFGSPAFGSSVNGVAAANTITQDSAADATGTASWFRVFQSDGTTVVFDGSVGTSGADLNLNSVAISAGATVSCSAFSYTQKKST